MFSSSRSRAGLVLTTLTALLMLSIPPTATAARVDRVSAAGGDWFASGSNLPYIRRGCDFGCGSNGGVTGNRRAVATALGQLADNGARTVRWEVFSGSATQVARTASGTPDSIDAAARNDLRVALDLAEDLDLYLILVVFPNPESLPAAWISDPSQRTKLADEVGNFARSLTADERRHILAWEVLADPERSIEAGHATAPDLAALATELADELGSRNAGPTMLTTRDATTLATWSSVPVSYFGVQWFSAMTDPAADVTTRSARALGVSKPVLVTAMDEPATRTAAFARLSTLRRLGYAGALGWSTKSARAYRNANATSATNLGAHWQLFYSNDDVGPRRTPRNPCLGPQASTLRCPDLVMSRPSDLYEKRTSSGRVLMLSTNSINSVGAGPAELNSRRRLGRFAMSAVQGITRKRGGRLYVDTGARLQFKAIPGQYRYWKWSGAATMELWSIDAQGRPMELVRRGPKTVYCLRDLRRTRPGIKNSPATMQYPACNQNLNASGLRLGTSVGWSDIYPQTYYENWVDVTGLRGCFAYVHIVDPDNVIYESNERNNSSAVSVRLPAFSLGKRCPGVQVTPTGSTRPADEDDSYTYGY